MRLEEKWRGTSVTGGKFNVFHFEIVVLERRSTSDYHVRSAGFRGEALSKAGCGFQSAVPVLSAPRWRRILPDVGRMLPDVCRIRVLNHDAVRIALRVESPDRVRAVSGRSGWHPGGVEIMVFRPPGCAVAVVVILVPPGVVVVEALVVSQRLVLHLTQASVRFAPRGGVRWIRWHPRWRPGGVSVV